MSGTRGRGSPGREGLLAGTTGSVVLGLAGWLAGLFADPEIG